MAFNIIIDNDGIYTFVEATIEAAADRLGQYNLDTYFQVIPPTIPRSIQIDDEENTGAVIIADTDDEFVQLEALIQEILDEYNEEAEEED